MNKKNSAQATAQTGCQRVFLLFFGGLFAFAGLAGFVAGCVSPIVSSLRARNWEETLCTITSSEIEINSDSDGTSYTPVIQYRYSLDGADFQGDRYSFVKIGGSRKRAQTIVDQYPVGTTSTCFYDPKSPSNSVLDRSMGIFPFLMGGFTSLFILVGAAVMFFAARSPSAATKSTSTNRTSQTVSWFLVNSVPTVTSPADWASLEGPQKLKPTQSRWASALGIGLFALIWDSIVSVFVIVFFFGGQFNWFFALLLTPFILIGLLLILAAIHQVLALFNPKVEVALSNGAVPMGDSIDVAWQLTGRTQRIKKLTVKVVGTEKVTYTRGTRTSTEDSNFFELDLFDGSNPAEFEFGTREFQVPGLTMHSFRAAKNEIIWKIVLHGEIPFWPDLNESFEFCVKPKALA